MKIIIHPFSRKYPDVENMSGIYCIKNLINNRMYIGSSVHVIDRMKRHLSELNKNIHCNNYFQKSFNKYGINNFRFIILEYTNNLKKREQYYIDLYSSANREFGYNISPFADRPTPWIKKKHHSEESKEKSRVSNTGQKRSSDTRKNMSIAQTGSKKSDITKKKHSLLWSGDKNPSKRPEIIAKIKEIRIKNNSYDFLSDPEYIKKRVETRKKNGWFKNPEEISSKLHLALLGKNKGKKRSDEANRKSVETRMKNGSYKRSTESIQKGINTKRRNGTY